MISISSNCGIKYVIIQMKYYRKSKVILFLWAKSLSITGTATVSPLTLIFDVLNQ